MELRGEHEKENRCHGIATCHNKSAKLVCKLAGCPVSELPNGERIGVHPYDPSHSVEINQIKWSAVLELPDVCPALVDFTLQSKKYRLPEGLK